MSDTPAAEQQGQLAHWKPRQTVELITGSVGDRLRHNAAHIGQRPALFHLIDEDSDTLDSLSYAELLAQAENCARWLAARCKPGERIAVWSRNALESVLLQYGCALSGNIITHFNTAWTDAELGHALELAQPSLLFAGEGHSGQDLLARARGLASCEVRPLADILNIADTRSEQPLPQVSENDPCLIQFTSGTTGKAKGSTLSHRAVLLGGWLRPHCEGASEVDVWLNAVPFHHIGGSIAVVVGALGVGGSFVVLPKYDRDQLIRLMPAVGATRMGGVPTMWLDILASGELSPSARLSSVSLGGASVSPELARAIHSRLGARCGIAYGQSEFAIITAVLPGDPIEIACDTVGRPLPHIEMKIIDAASGETLGVNETGEICVRGPTCMDGYWANPAATAETIDAEGFLHTGDIGSLDTEGYCRIKGRLREVIIRGGENIYPVEVENALQSHPDVALSAVVAIPHPRLGQDVAAAVKLRPGSSTTAEALEAHTRQLVASYKVPKTWRFVDSMPVTASGKIRKIELEALFTQE